MLMNKRLALVIFRLVFGLLDLVALTVQVLYLIHHKALDLVNFFSYFTILSNIFVSFMLIAGAIYLLRRRKPTHSEELVRNATVLYMAVTGIVYATLLAGQSLGLLLPWVNAVLHMIMPVVVVADWLYQPPRTKLKMKQLPLLMIFPITFLGYSLIRGPIVGWYPYLFLNPSKAGGYIGVTLYCLGILVLFFVLGWLLNISGGKLKRHIA
jgi:hypothetical protein